MKGFDQIAFARIFGELSTFETDLCRSFWWQQQVWPMCMRFSSLLAAAAHKNECTSAKMDRLVSIMRTVDLILRKLIFLFLGLQRERGWQRSIQQPRGKEANKLFRFTRLPNLANVGFPQSNASENLWFPAAKALWIHDIHLWIYGYKFMCYEILYEFLYCELAYEFRMYNTWIHTWITVWNFRWCPLPTHRPASSGSCSSQLSRRGLAQSKHGWQSGSSKSQRI